MTFDNALVKQLLRNVIGGGNSLTFALLLTLVLSVFAACSEDTPDSVPTPPVTRTIADSTVTDSAAAIGIAVTVDTAWAGTLRYRFDSEGNITPEISTDDIAEGDVADAV